MKNLQVWLLIFIFSSLANGQAIFSDYIGTLQPLMSTDTDVANRLGKPSVIGSKHFHKTKDANIEVTYAKDCRWEKSGRRVESNLIRYIAFFPIKPLYFKELGIDTSSFSKSPTDADLPSVIAFSNRKIGISFNVDMNAMPELGGTVGLVTLWGGAEKAIMCSDK